MMDLDFKPHKCPVCDKHEFQYEGRYEVCPVCKWTDDLVQNEDHDFWGGANDLCVKDFRKEWLAEQKENEGNICPVCNKFRFEEEDNFDICEVCGWEDDIIQYEDHDYAGGANPLSVNQFRKEWLAEQKENEGNTCPVCNQFRFEEEGDFSICGVCGWENDNVQFDDHDYWGGANELSVNDFRKEWLAEQKAKG